MLKMSNYDIVFREVPDETSLALTITNCPFRCQGCHSAHLRKDVGEPINIYSIEKLLNKYHYVTTVLFLGGDSDYSTLHFLCQNLKLLGYKTAFYSGADKINQDLIKVLDYYKIGSYKEELGGLDSPTTNQKMFKISDGELIDITNKFNK